MENTPLPSVTALPPVAAALCGGRAPCPSPKPARRTFRQSDASSDARKILPDLSNLALRALPRVAHLADSPSLFALALIAEGVSALIPDGFRSHKENLS